MANPNPDINTHGNTQSNSHLKPNPNPNPNPQHNVEIGHGIIDRSGFSAYDVVRDIWTSLKLPPHALKSLHLPGHGPGPALASSFKIGILAQSSIALSALAAAVLSTTTTKGPLSQDEPHIPLTKVQRQDEGKEHGGIESVPRVSVPLDHAVLEFRSEQLYRIEGSEVESAWGRLGGLHRTRDGYIRIHDVFPNHSEGMLGLLGLPPTASREDVAAKALGWSALDLEDQGTHRGKLAMYALRSYEEWDALPQAKAVGDDPIMIRHTGVPTTSAPATNPTRSRSRTCSRTRAGVAPSARCLQGIRVLEMSRVIAAPVAGRTLAAHGADVIWVTSPNLPDIPSLDRDLSRGKRSVHLDLEDPADMQTLLGLLATCDVFLQGYRPGSLAARGLSPEALAAVNPGIVIANMSAFGPHGPWAGRRGFDSLVQTCSGMNVSEAAHARVGGGEEGLEEEEAAARAMPCQALDHASGYLLAAGVMAALYHRKTSGGGGRPASSGGCAIASEGARTGAYVVDVSLAGTMKYLRSLGQYPGRTGFELAPPFSTHASSSKSSSPLPSSRRSRSRSPSPSPSPSPIPSPSSSSSTRAAVVVEDSSGTDTCAERRGHGGAQGVVVPAKLADVREELVEERVTPFGKMKGLRHSADVEGCEVGWERGPSLPGGDEPHWLEGA